MNDAGKVCMMPKGTWSASVTYEFLDVVKFAQNSWVAKQSSINQEPSENSQYWQLLAKGTTEQYGTSNTAAATAAKVATTTDGDFELSTGASVKIKFANTDTAGSCTLSVDGTTAKAIYYNGAAIEAGILTAGNAFEFVYDGTNFVMVGSAGGAKAFEVSQAEYDALPAAQKNDPNKMWFISDNDYPAVPQSATGTSFDDAEVGFTAANVQGAIEKLASMIYPVGSIYMSVNNVNPSIYFGGTWVAWGSGRVPVGVSTDAEFDTVEKTGGEKTHTLTGAESGQKATGDITTGKQSANPTVNGGRITDGISGGNHDHQVMSNGGSGNFYNISIISGGSGATDNPIGKINPLTPGSHTHTLPNHMHSVSGDHTHTFSIAASNATNAHNNLQPYITCYMWKRTA